MVHCKPDFKTKKDFMAYFKSGKKIEVYQPGFFPLSPNGTTVIEYPAHYHKCYTRVEYRDFIVVKVIS